MLCLVRWMENRKERIVKSLGDRKEGSFPSSCLVEEKENKKMSNQMHFTIITSYKLGDDARLRSK